MDGRTNEDCDFLSSCWSQKQETSLIWNRNIYSFWKAFCRLGNFLVKDSCTLVQTDVLCVERERVYFEESLINT